MKKAVIVFAVILSFSAAAHADWAGFLKQIKSSAPQTSNVSQIASGLKEALRVGTEKAVEMTGRTDGYFKNEAIKILMPEKLRAAEGMLRKIGMGNQIDQFVLSMNRAAEAAAPQAKSIFLKSLSGMTIDDAVKIYNGGDTAATQYFQAKTSDELAKLYRPVVEKSMSQYQVSGLYQGLAGKYNALPLAKNFKLPEIEDYVVKQSLTGLFKVLGDQEKAIRKDPAARVTQILKDVFSKPSA